MQSLRNFSPREQQLNMYIGFCNSNDDNTSRSVMEISLFVNLGLSFVLKKIRSTLFREFASFLSGNVEIAYRN